jgi:mRNA interferase RelE/StbE
MAYELVLSKKAVRQLDSLNNSDASIIVKWLDKNIQGCEDPRSHGKPLKGNMAGYWRYRIGKYRVICTIDDGKLIVLAVTIGKRDAVYDRLQPPI